MITVKRSLHNERGGVELLVLAIVIIASFVLVGGPITFHGTQSQNQNQPVNIQNNSQTFNPNQSLQIQGLGASTPSPVPSQAPPISRTGTNYPSSCGIANQYMGPGGNECGPGNCVMDGAPSATNPCCPGVTQYNGHSLFGANAPDQWCDAKPVIYLYPQKPENVSVKIEVPGVITLSIPRYNNGWNNILAMPDGTLMYKNNLYSELFYETSQEKSTPPKNGVIVKKSELSLKLSSIVTSLGLNEKEKTEFVSYWLPRLEKINNPYVLISVFTGNAKEKIDKVKIYPKPDTFIQFIMYFKGVNNTYPIEPIVLPKTPERKGFTAVEWGGILDY